jgi:hypothetical protein
MHALLKGCCGERMLLECSCIGKPQMYFATFHDILVYHIPCVVLLLFPVWIYRKSPKRRDKGNDDNDDNEDAQSVTSL